jgi:Na+-translocating ferredoxin:NAD+ oxidoreductase subunit E
MTERRTPSLDISWQRPVFLLPLFCLASLLGVTDTLASAISMSLVMLVLILVTSALTFTVHRMGHTHTLTWLLLGAGVITLMELLLHAFAYALYRKLDIYLPLCAIAALLLMRETLRGDMTTWPATFKRAFLMSSGFALAAWVLGTGREIVGHGSLFSDAGELWGAWATPLALQFFAPDMGFLLGILAPGAFVALGLGVALYNQLWLILKRIK